MKYLATAGLLVSTALPVFAETERQLDAHVHGVGKLNIAVDGDHIVMELEAPGADIVGFEHPAASDEDHAAIDAAVDALSHPLDLFALTAKAGCTVEDAHAALEGDDHKEEHDHKDEHGHDDHKEDHHAEHKHDDHAAHDDHDDHDDHGEEAGHTEFHAEYMLVCKDVSAVEDIKFNYFDTFPNALEVEVQLVGASGAQAFEVERDAPNLSVKGLF